MVSLLAVACTEPASPPHPDPDPVPAALHLVGAPEPSGALGALLDDEIAVRVVDDQDEPVEDVEVQWSITSGGGALSGATSRTAADGIARVAWTLGTRLDAPQRAEARVGTLSPLELRATALVPADARLERADGHDQTDVPGAMLPGQLVARFVLADDRPIRGAAVSWAAVSGSGLIHTSEAATDEDGLVSASVALGQVAGIYVFRATVAGGPTVDFQATARAVVPLVLTTEVVVPGTRGIAPIYIASLPGDDRLFIADVRGSIHVLQNRVLASEPLLSIRDRVLAQNEQGFLSFALHPSFATNGHVYVNYTDHSGNTVIERYTLQPGAQTIDPASVKRLLYIIQPFGNHNGGLMKFGLDGYLYIGMGDGGSGGDPFGNGQSLGTLHGKMLRIDVNSGDPYAIPPGNPFAGRADARPEIWGLGLRNPWRWSFDRVGGMLYVADVGQARWEEINAVPWQTAGINYGWNLMEGAHCYDDRPCDPAGLTLPAHEYDHGEGCSVIGGYVYRGALLPELYGHYVYADLCHNWVRAFRLEGGVAVEHREWQLGPIGAIFTFGEDGAGELYLGTSSMTVYRLTRAP